MNTGDSSRSGAPRGRRGAVPVDAAARSIHKHREALFLEAWKRAIHCAGLQFFEIRSAHFLELAAHRDQLRPDHRAIRRALDRDLNAAEGLFLCALYGIYNADEGRRLAHRHYPDCRSREQMLDVFDAERRAILEALLNNYSDW